MKKKLPNTVGLICYLLVMGKLLDFNWLLLISPKPFLSVTAGTIILTLSQYKKVNTKEDILVSIKWNLLFSSFLTTLMALLSFISALSANSLNITRLAHNLLPLLYGSIIYLILNLIFETNAHKQDSKPNTLEAAELKSLLSLSIADQVFKDFGLTTRECHVAAKLLENVTNKEIASHLYISETTVKKHIQNIYQKFQATDRSSFKDIYTSKAGDICRYR